MKAWTRVVTVCKTSARKSKPMKITVLGKPACCLVAVLVTAGLAASPPPLAGSEPLRPTKPKAWRVKYQGTGVKLIVGPDRIVGNEKRREAFSIPVADVTGITYDTRVENLGALRALEGVFGAGVPAGSSPGEGMGVLIVLAAAGTAALLDLIPIEKHFVHIGWQEQGEARHVIFETNLFDYRRLLTELERVTGKPLRNLAAERKKIWQELEREKDKKIDLDLSRRVQVGQDALEPGHYQAVLLPRQQNRGELYFFAGRGMNTKKIAAMALVEIVPEASAAGEPITYTEACAETGAATTIAEIGLTGKTLRFVALPGTKREPCGPSNPLNSSRGEWDWLGG